MGRSNHPAISCGRTRNFKRLIRSPLKSVLLCTLVVAMVCGLAKCFASPSIRSFNGMATREARVTRRATGVSSFEENDGKDDGRILDTNTFAGGIGGITVSFAVLPYVPLSLYNSFLVATTGEGIEPGPLGLFGLATGMASLVVLAVSFWSLGSLLTRARGLPEGLLSCLGLTQGLSVLSSFLLVGATFLNGGDAGDNPLRGFTVAPEVSEFGVSIVQQLAAGVSQVSGVVGDEMVKAGGPLGEQLEAKLGEGAAKFGEGASRLRTQIPNVDVPEFKPNFNIPEKFKMPDSFKMPDIKMPDVSGFKLPQMPELKAPAAQDVDEDEMKS